MPHVCGVARLRSALAAAVLLSSAVPAAAMNWEGHDDWMRDSLPGVEAFTAGAAQQPLPGPPCPAPRKALANPYEQIPLAGQACTPPPAAGREPPPAK